MIRIDLGKDDSQKKAGAKLFDRISGASIPGLGAVKNILTSTGGLALLIIAAASSFVPHVAFVQYRALVISQNKAAVREAEEKAALLEKEIQKLAPYQKELQTYEEQRKLLKDRIDLIKQLLQQRGTPISVLDSVGQSLPARTWVDSINLNKGTELTIGGYALSNEDISDFVDKLSESVFIDKVTLEQVTSEMNSQSGDRKRFTLNAKARFSQVSKAPDPDQRQVTSAPGNSNAPPPTAAEGAENAETVK